MLELKKNELRVYWTASKTSDVDLFILALIFRFWGFLAKKIGYKI